MQLQQSVVVQTNREFKPTQDRMLGEVLHGLSEKQKSIPSKFLYDKKGSEIFDKICELPEYYPTRTELSIFRQMESDLREILKGETLLIELGSGSSNKLDSILSCASKDLIYMPIDISKEHLMEAMVPLKKRYPSLKTYPVWADYSAMTEIPGEIECEKRLLFFPGSTIGNFEPTDAQRFLALWHHLLKDGDGLLIGVDTKKSIQILEPAYNDAQGVTASFNLNLLSRINRELGADFDEDLFLHRAPYVEELGRIEMHLVSKRKQSVCVADNVFHFEMGEYIHTESSYKYAPEEFRTMARMAGWEPVMMWTDSEGLFSVHYLSKTHA